MQTTAPQATNQPSNKPERSTLARIILFLLPLLVVGIGVVIAVVLIKSKPVAKQRVKTKIATVVEVAQIQFANQKITIEAMGTVTAARTISLSSQVGGQIISTSPNFQPGGLFGAGDTILKIDPADYQLTLRQRQADMENAKNELTMEHGNQLVAQREFELLGEDVSETERNLMLRQPQLSTLKSSFESMKAKYNQAELDLSRTEVKAPFNGIIETLSTNIGARVSSGTALAEFIGTDTFWLELSVPVNQLQWITIPQDNKTIGSTVRIYNDAFWGENQFREGTVVRLAASLETNGRMARLIVKITDPLAMAPENADAPRLLLDSYVRVEIEGKNIESVAQISREHIRSGNSIWIRDAQGNLEIRPIEILFKNRNSIILAGGVAAGESYVTSSISAPVEGMAIKLEKSGAEQKNSRKNNSKGMKEKTNG